MSAKPLITIAVPSYNQGRYLDQALTSIFQQGIPVEVFVMDGGSVDNTIDVIKKWENRLSGWRSHADKGQAAAINEGIAAGKAPFVCWLNSDDWYLPEGLSKLLTILRQLPDVPAIYGQAWNFIEKKQTRNLVWVEPFNERRMAIRCIISQPATLIRRSAWEAVRGVNENLYMAMDYDLWWRLYKTFGPLHFVKICVAVNREHANTKTKNQRSLHYRESISVVRQHYGSVPIKWWCAQPYSVWFKALIK